MLSIISTTLVFAHCVLVFFTIAKLVALYKLRDQMLCHSLSAKHTFTTKARTFIRSEVELVIKQLRRESVFMTTSTIESIAAYILGVIECFGREFDINPREARRLFLEVLHQQLEADLVRSYKFNLHLDERPTGNKRCRLASIGSAAASCWQEGTKLPQHLSLEPILRAHVSSSNVYNFG